MTDAAERALALALEAKSDIDTHEAVCAERYGNINKVLDDLKKLQIWLLGLLASSLVAGLGWALVHINEIGDQHEHELEKQIQTLQSRPPVVFAPAGDRATMTQVVPTPR